ncbi:acetyl-CoA carboxylase biotin carboxyl carrier protein [Weissella tructae]|uniref:Biotin carboxyl carrier protein of acetyl-CoA carboxylase n=2 Tax=Weissella TaxID=46255 RepID=A0A075U5V6_9LACO|nr:MULTISPECIES: acetyl-CoA carboxylase biotin carboxyl carrier protein subunit [Weissella]AIG65502.1 Acetyl-CoA carboxylase, biotin carboxyl carrier protein [Weissella tructae]AIM62815.1 Acetyl-CoA carboxylase, biotin carboxyl carrier protein [Weissella ceti]AIM64150.1 Acetyl-CoA carboxylase, biotin carboxyl carrier protein [Weissella ceti]ELA07039.1 Acetyl-CoA carboxylase, biotin carboxyl carrier protein [Weissella ceti NC36]QVV91875.1 acetyl-CoA carboxylase biotin carboxyl carrier protein s
MELTLTDVERLMQQFEASELRELHLESAPVVLTLSKNEWHHQAMPTPAPVEQGPTGDTVSAMPMTGDAVTVAESATDTDAIKAELVGTVHLQASPEAEPFVQVGQKIKAGDQVAIIEAMKLMTPVISPVSGIIQTISVANNDVVAYDDVLFEVTPMEG